MEADSELVFSVGEIRDSQGLEASLLVPPEQLFETVAADAALDGPVEVDLDFSVGGDLILLQAKLKGSWRVPCSRCLVEHRRGFSAAAEETYPMTEESIDLRKDFQEIVLMEVPLRSLCREDCKGLCVSCGRNLNEGACDCPPPASAPTSSPFEVLRKLKQ